jgi:hypothetical protein
MFALHMIPFRWDFIDKHICNAVFFFVNYVLHFFNIIMASNVTINIEPGNSTSKPITGPPKWGILDINMMHLTRLLWLSNTRIRFYILRYVKTEPMVIQPGRCHTKIWTAWYSLPTALDPYSRGIVKLVAKKGKKQGYLI